ncbi:MAG TPA: outer membrane beta-barrel protein [Bacteroidales bacterium]|nr:outer membrane beta-barrel protein [Bacteroidales bacterium]HNS46319.1 outer membrane beta-barrel protein [Bacteroidales bacterium]
MKSVLSTLLVILSLMAGAQTSDGYMGVMMGVAIPTGDFASGDSLNPQAGYATTSFNLTMDGAYYINPYVGFGGAVSFSNNSLNTGDLKRSLEWYIHKNYPDAELPEDLTLISYDLGVWNHVNLMVGPYFSIPVNQFHFDFRALGGLAFVFSPDSEMYFMTADDEFRTYRENKNPVSLGYMVGGGIRYVSRSNAIIRLMCDYSSTKTTIEITDYFIENESPLHNPPTEHTQPMNTIHVGLGIGYAF